jgi:hypothetical protein
MDQERQDYADSRGPPWWQPYAEPTDGRILLVLIMVGGGVAAVVLWGALIWAATG